MGKCKRFVNLRPLFVVVLCYVLGILAYFCTLFINESLGYSLLAFATVFLLVLYLILRKNYPKFLFLIFTAVCLLMLSAGFFYSLVKTDLLSSSVDVKEDYVTGKVVSVSVGESEEHSYTAVIVKDGRKRIKFYLDGQNEIYYGDIVTFKGSLKAVSYDKNNIAYRNLINEITHTSSNVKQFQVRDRGYGILSRCRIKIRNTLKENYPQDVFAIAYALITGEDSGVDIKLLTSYRHLGIAHIFAVSGLHIGIFFGLLTGLCRLLKIKDKLSFVIITIVLTFYVMLCGGSASSIRAEVICLTALLVKIIGVKNDGLSTMSFSAIVVLLINPFNLFSVGFILSYAVYGTLIIISPVLERNLNKLFLPTFSKIMASYLPTTIISCVLSSYFFGYTSIYTFFANLIIVPLMPIIYSLTLITVIVTTVFPSLGAVLLPSGAMIKGLNCVVSRNFIEMGLLKGLEVKYTLIPLFGALPIYGEYFNVSRKNNAIFACSSMGLTVITFILENVL